jgi:hypothetical protein
MSSEFVRQIDLSLIPIDSTGNRITFFLSKLPVGRYGFHILFDLSNYSLSKHLCYMKPKQKDDLENIQSLRFYEMAFYSSPPGLEVGPWPGWRGIPDMPKIKLVCGNQITEARYNFWGDEIECNTVRVIAYLTFDSNMRQSVSIEWENKNFQPLWLEIFPNSKPSVRPIPVKLLPKLKNSHPRLLFSKDDLISIRSRRYESHKALWEKIESLLTDNWSLEFQLTPESKTLSGAERLNDLDRVVLSAFHALVTEENDSIQRARDTFVVTSEKALQPDYEPMRIDTQAGECLFSFCVSYDWLCTLLSDDDNTKFQHNLFQLAEKVWRHLGYERDDFGQAHFLGCSHGLLAFSFLFWEEHPRAQEWAAYLHGVFQAILGMLPDDGFYPHGINLWIYEHTFLLRYLELFRQNACIDFWNKNEYWKNASLFRQLSLSPDLSMAITFGDPQFRVSGDAWMHYLIADRCKSEAAQSLGQLLEEGNTEGVDFRSVPPRRQVWEFLYYNPKITNKHSKLQTHFFPDGGQLFIRNKSEKVETLITFRAGMPLGRQRFLGGEWSGYGHSDPCQGSFLICKGKSFLMSGPGAVYRRDTQLHNTITIDGRGQTGDGMVWAPDFTPLARTAVTKKYMESEELTQIEVDLTSTYLDFLGVKKLKRRFINISPALILVHDYIQLAKKRQIEWNIHSYGNFFELPDYPDLSFEIADNEQSIRLTCLTPRELEWETGLSEFVPAYPNPGTRDHFLKLYKKGETADFLFLLILDDASPRWSFDWDSSKTRWHHIKLNVNNKDFTIENYPTVAA